MKQEMTGGSGIRWTIYKSFAPSSRQITTPVDNHLVLTDRMPFLLPNQQHQTTEALYQAQTHLNKNLASNHLYF